MDAITPAEAAAALAAYDGLLRRRVQWGLRDRPYEDGMGLDDYLQEARIRAHALILRHDPSRGPTLSWWAWRCVGWAAAYVTRPLVRRVSLVEPLEALPEEAEYDHTTGSEAIEFTVDMNVVRAAATALPSDWSRDVLRVRYLDGDSTLSEAGAARGRSRERARQIEREGILTLRRDLLGFDRTYALESRGWWWLTEHRLNRSVRLTA